MSWEQPERPTNHVQQTFRLKYIIRLVDKLFKFFVLRRQLCVNGFRDLALLCLVVLVLCLRRGARAFAILAFATVSDFLLVHIITGQNCAIPRIIGGILGVVTTLTLHTTTQLRFASQTRVVLIHLP